MQKSEDPKTSNPQSLSSESLYHNGRSTPYFHKRLCTVYLFNFCSRIATSVYTVLVLHRKYDVNGNLLSCTLCNITWQPCLPTYSPPKILSPATLSSNSFLMHLWCELLSLSSPDQKLQNVPLLSDLLQHILSIMVTWKLNRAYVGLYSVFSFTIILALCSYLALGQQRSYLLAWFSAVRVRTMLYPSLCLPTGLSHNWNLTGQKKQVLFKMRDLLKSERCQLKWSVCDKNLQSRHFSNSFSCWFSNIYANDNQEKHRCWKYTKPKLILAS